jgi:hypothetical protein
MPLALWRPPFRKGRERMGHPHFGGRQQDQEPSAFVEILLSAASEQLLGVDDDKGARAAGEERPVCI